MDDLKHVFNRMGLLDLVFLIPMALLFAYLPSTSFVGIVLNVVIVVFFSFGLAMAFHMVVDSRKKRKNGAVH
ncbi:DUF6007 family protein [Ornithinibacillus sp. JPR2-1]|uniref:DUF6007 family protein n=1 Tax=Ornithinibacillus sp. JPR2-1 TaxID=2094019 RepID=UPI0031CF6313